MVALMVRQKQLTHYDLIELFNDFVSVLSQLSFDTLRAPGQERGSEVSQIMWARNTSKLDVSVSAAEALLVISWGVRRYNGGET